MILNSPYRQIPFLLLPITILILTGLACARSAQPDEPPSWRVPGQGASKLTAEVFHPQEQLPGRRAPGEPILTPTPDEPHPIPTLRVDPIDYVVQPGDTLGLIAQRYSLSLEALIQANQLTNPNILEIGQGLVIPVPTPGGEGPAFKVIPDSELVYGPAARDFDIAAFIQEYNGYLARYTEEVNERKLSGTQIVAQVAQNYSVNPRLLLAVLEYQSGWLTNPTPDASTLEYPLGIVDSRREGLYRQLSWAANNLNQGYYLWRVNGAATWLLGDGSVVPVDTTINAGTAGVQQMFAPLYGRDAWRQAVTEPGLFATYQHLFGYPFDYAVEPLLPHNLRQPPMQLPFEPGRPWAFTGGPHGGWGSGSAWAALDFAPPSEALGCIPSDDWVVAVADGAILRAGDGAVVQELDNDGYEGTGWAVLYMHIETRERVQPGAVLRAGERIGHPSCEGGVSSGTHVHLARKYNGEWIPADQNLPFVLDGWVSRGTGNLYDGYLEKEGKQIEAWEGRSEENVIQR